MSYIAQRREEEKERRRGEIVDAAVSLYLDIGWEAATMDEVARRARLSRALVYVYFKDKGDLHFAIVERALRALRERFELAASGQSTGLAKVQAIGRAYVAFSREVPHYFNASSRFQSISPKVERRPQRKRSSRSGPSCARSAGGSIQAGIADGSIRKDLGDPVMTGIALWGFTHGIIQVVSSKDA